MVIYAMQPLHLIIMVGSGLGGFMSILAITLSPGFTRQVTYPTLILLCLTRMFHFFMAQLQINMEMSGLWGIIRILRIGFATMMEISGLG